MRGVDLNLVGRYSELFRGVAREHRQDAFRPADGFSALEHFCADCCPLRWRRPGPNALLCRAIPRDGVRATDLSREPARYRGLPIGARVETLSHRFSRAGPTINSGRRQRDARLAHLRGIRSPSDCPSEEALCQRKPGRGAGQHGPCSGFHDHRSVPVAISMGALSLHQGGGEDAHVARSARQHPELRPHLERQAARRSCSRSAATRSRRHLCHGSRLRRLRAALRLASSWRLLRYPCKVEPGCAPRLLGADRSGDRYHYRPDYRIGWLFYQQRLSRSSAPRPNSRMLHREKGWCF